MFQTNLGAISIEGNYYTDSKFKIGVNLGYNFKDSTQHNFIHSVSFEFNHWVYIGVCISRKRRVENIYDIHIASKTSLSIENENSFINVT